MCCRRTFSFLLPPVKNIGCSEINRRRDLEGGNRDESIAQVYDKSGEHVIQRRGRSGGRSWAERRFIVIRKQIKMDAIVDG